MFDGIAEREDRKTELPIAMFLFVCLFFCCYFYCYNKLLYFLQFLFNLFLFNDLINKY